MVRIVSRRKVTPTHWALLSIAGFFLFTTSAFAANRYWVGAANNSSVWEDPANWSDFDRGLGGASIPGAADIAIFTFSGNTVLIRSAVVVKGLSRQGTGSLLLGTGSLSVGTTGIRIGSGSLIGGTGLLTTSGSYTQTGGTVSGVQGTFSLSGSLSITKARASSSFTSTGTIIFRGVADQNFTVGTGTTTSFSAITVNNAGGTTNDDILVYSVGGLQLSGALTVTLGNFDLGSSDTTLNLEGNLAIANAAQATFTTDKNVIANGNISVGAAGGFTLTGATLTLNGGTQTLDTNNDVLTNLIIGSTTSATLAADQSIVTKLQVNTGATFALSSFTLFATGGTVVNFGTINENTGKIALADTNFIISESTYTSQQAIFPVASTLYFTLTDRDENVSGTAADTVFILVTTNNGDSEGVTLTELNNTAGIFNGSITTLFGGTSSGNGIIEASRNLIVTASYTDAQDALSSTDTADLNLTDSPTGGTGAVTRGAGGKAARAELLKSRREAAKASTSEGPVIQIDYNSSKVAPRAATVQQKETAVGRKTQSLLRKKDGGEQEPHKAVGGPSVSPVREQATETFKTRVCDRVLRWFRGNRKMMERINSRLTGRFNFLCQE